MGPKHQQIPPFSWAVLTRLGKTYLSRFPGVLALYLITALITQSILPVFVPLLAADITNQFQQSEKGPLKSGADVKTENAPSPAVSDKSASNLDLGHLRFLFFVWAALITSLWALNFLAKCVQTYFSGVMARSMRKDLFESILRQSPNFFMSRDKNELNAIINQFTIQAQMGLRQLLVDPIIQVFGIGMAGWALFGQIMSKHPSPHMWMAMAAIALFGLTAPWVTGLLGGRLQRATGAVQQQNLRMSTLVGNALNAPEEIQAMQAETFFGKKHDHELDSTLNLNLRQTYTIEGLNVVNTLPSDIVVIALMALLVFFMAAHAGGAAGAAGTIIALLMLTPQFMGQVQALSGYSISRSMAWPCIAMVNDIISLKPEVVEQAGAREIETIDGTLEARNVVFSYDPGRPILNGFSLKVTPQKWTGLIGRSGQGKSTFFRLVLRFFDFQSGDIMVGNIPVREFRQSSLRRLVALMVQLPAFFFDTLRENMRVARPDATDDEIRAACEMTGIWSILVELLGPNPLEAQLAGGAMLSGGQKRRLAISRGLLRKPSIIFMDEPTVGLNPEDKLPLIPVLRKACEGKTVLLVEQDILWLEQICDHILVLDHGKIVQQGTPAELAAQGGLYLQMRDSYVKSKEAKEAKEALAAA
jgi:ATP-binding cassette subfamily B protein